jgi:hypothetical protein
MAGRTGVSAGLKEIVADYQSRGVDLSTDPRLAEAILLDSFPEAPAEINALVEAIRSGAIEYMRDRAAQGAEFSVHGSATQLSESAGLREDLARWAVESWWNALSLGAEIPNREAEAAATTGVAAAAVVVPPPPPPPPPPPAGASPTPTQAPPIASPPPMPAAVPLMGSSEMTQTAGEAAPVGQPAAVDPTAYPGGGQQYPPAPPAAVTGPQAGQPAQPTAAASAQYPPGSQGPPQQPPQYPAGSQVPPPPYPQYPPGSQGPPQQPPLRPPGSQGPPQQPPASSGRGKFIAIAIVVVVLLAYVGTAAAAHLPPFSRKPVAATTTTTTTPSTTTTTTTSSTTTTTTTPTSTTSGTRSATLLSDIPIANASTTCTPQTVAEIANRAPGAQAAYDCTPEVGLDVLYAIFPTTAAAESTYNATIKGDVPAGLKTGFCSTSNSAQDTYINESTKKNVGDLACFPFEGEQYLFWWHFSDDIVSLATSSSLTLAQMLKEWAGLGPN